MWLAWWTGCAPTVIDVQVAQPWHAQEVVLDVTLTQGAPVAAVCRSTTVPMERHVSRSDASVLQHQLRLAGLLADHTYRCEVGIPDGDRVDRTVMTRPPVEDLPVLNVLAHDEAAGSEYVLVNHGECTPNSPQRVAVFDRNGAVRWWADTTPTFGPAVAFAQVSDDEMAWAGGWSPLPDGRLQVRSLFGADLRSDSGDAYADLSNTLFHHEGRRLPDGRDFNLERVIVDGGAGTQFGFRLRRVDPDSNTVDFDYHSQRALDEGHLPAGAGNAWHANWATLTQWEGASVALVSLCFLQRIVAIDVPSGDWRWSFGIDGDFAFVDADGTQLPDDAFPQCQHGIDVLGNRLLVYDNGVNRGFSQIQEIVLDESTMVATRRAVWTEPDWFEVTFGSVQELPGPRWLIGMGHNTCFGDVPDDRTTVVELDRTDDRVVWRAEFPLAVHTTFRANHAGGCALFANQRFCPELEIPEFDD